MKLIIGATGYIGNKIFEYFSKKGESVIATSYSKEEGMIPFDLENPNLNNLGVDLKEVDYAFICSAITKIDECKRDEEKAYKINVLGTKSVIEQLFQLNIIPVFFSSDFVFDGKKGDYTEEDITNPCTVYGTHKKIIEDFLLGTNKEFLIARLSKMFGLTPGDGTILTSWVEDLIQGKTIRCATDQRFSPTYIGDLTKALDIALQKKLRGLYNISSPESFNRFKLANMLKSQLGIKSGEIVPCSINDLDFLDARSLDTSTNKEKFTRETGFVFTKMKDCIENLKNILFENNINTT